MIAQLIIIKTTHSEADFLFQRVVLSLLLLLVVVVVLYTCCVTLIITIMFLLIIIFLISISIIIIIVIIIIIIAQARPLFRGLASELPHAGPPSRPGRSKTASLFKQ